MKNIVKIMAVTSLMVIGLTAFQLFPPPYIVTSTFPSGGVVVGQSYTLAGIIMTNGNPAVEVFVATGSIRSLSVSNTAFSCNVENPTVVGSCFIISSITDAGGFGADTFYIQVKDNI